MSKRKFTGALATRVPPRVRTLLDSDAEISTKVEKWTDEDFKKLALLCADYGIPDGPSQHTHLALAMARDFVEGFKEEIPVGRRAKWGGFELMALVVEVERLVVRGSRSKGVSWAAIQLAKREPWRSFVEERGSENEHNAAEVLRKQYNAARRTFWARVARNGFQWHLMQGTVAEWDAMVLGIRKQ